MSLRGGGLCEDVSHYNPPSLLKSVTNPRETARLINVPPFTVLLLLRRMLCPGDDLLLSRRRGGR